MPGAMAAAMPAAQALTNKPSLNPEQIPVTGATWRGLVGYNCSETREFKGILSRDPLTQVSGSSWVSIGRVVEWQACGWFKTPSERLLLLPNLGAPRLGSWHS